jgi:hypothetical protein
MSLHSGRNRYKRRAMMALIVRGFLPLATRRVLPLHFWGERALLCQFRFGRRLTSYFQWI